MTRASRSGVRLRGSFPVFEPLEARQLLASLLVTNANDSGSGSLRQAILDADAVTGASKIDFAIPGSGLQKIELTTALPMIVQAVDIDARTQPGYASSPLVEIDGMASLNGAGTDAGLDFEAGSTGASVEGLAIVRFAAGGIFVSNQNGVTIQADDIGYDPSGGTAQPGNSNGIVVNQGTNLVIGGPTPADGNIIDSSGRISQALSPYFFGDAINIDDRSSQVTIQNNIIGTDPKQTAVLGNAADGISLNYTLGCSVLSNTIANSGNQAIVGTAYDTVVSGNVLINNGTSLATLTQTASPVTAFEGTLTEVTYTITNTGPATATNIKFSAETVAQYDATYYAGRVPPAVYGTQPASLFSVLSLYPLPVVPPTGLPLTLNLGSLVSGASTTATVLINAYTAGTDRLVTNLSADQFTLTNYQGMSIGTPVTIIGRPDLAVTALKPTGTARLGIPYTFQFLVTNHDTAGLAEADFQVRGVPLPTSVLNSVTPSQGISFGILGPYQSAGTSTPTFYFDGGDLGELAPGASARVTVTITPTQPGPLTVLFASSGANDLSTPDVHPVDNLAYASVPVTLAPAVASTALAPTAGNIQFLTINFEGPLNAKTATNLRDYTLTTTAPGKPTTISLRSAQYNATTHVVTLGLSHPLSRTGTPLKLILTGLTGTDGTKLPAGSGVVMVPR